MTLGEFISLTNTNNEYILSRQPGGMNALKHSRRPKAQLQPLMSGEKLRKLTAKTVEALPASIQAGSTISGTGNNN